MGEPGSSEPTFSNFDVYSAASLHVAVALTRTLPFVQDLSVEDRVQLSTVVSELGTNILKFAGKGTVSLARTTDGGHDAIRVRAQDTGPGIRDVARAMQDGYSTAGTLGLGLPAVRRMMSTMHVESAVGKGTTVTAHKWIDGTSPAPVRSAADPRPCLTASVATADPRSPREAAGALRIEVAHHGRPYPGETVSGDVAVLRPVEAGLLFGVIDASGHGPEAAAIALRLSGAVVQAASTDIPFLLRTLHGIAAGTRGAAAGLAWLDRAGRRLTFAGIGNVHVRVLGPRPWRGVSRDGILGERLPGLLPQTVALAPGDVVLMASDGVSESARPDVLLYGLRLPASQIAESVIREAGKSTDDATCVVVKCLEPAPSSAGRG